MKEKTRAERYAEKWFAENGFEYSVRKQYISKTVYAVSKDSVTDTFELPSTVTEPKKYMDMYAESFELKKEIIRMKAELA